MRDLHAAGSPASRNGAFDVVDAMLRSIPEEPEGPTPASPPADVDRAYRQARVDSATANVAMMIWEATQRLEPIAGLLSRLLLRWAALACFSILVGYVVIRSGGVLSWPLIAVLGMYPLGAGLIFWRKN